MAKWAIIKLLISVAFCLPLSLIAQTHNEQIQGKNTNSGTATQVGDNYHSYPNATHVVEGNNYGINGNVIVGNGYPPIDELSDTDLNKIKRVIDEYTAKNGVKRVPIGIWAPCEDVNTLKLYRQVHNFIERSGYFIESSSANNSAHNFQSELVYINLTYKENAFNIPDTTKPYIDITIKCPN